VPTFKHKDQENTPNYFTIVKYSETQTINHFKLLRETDGRGINANCGSGKRVSRWVPIH
jgi:hypothetical protein